MPRAPTPQPLRADDPLLAFALRHAAITPFFGSRQHTDRDAYVLAERTMPDYNLIHVQAGAAVWTVDGVDHRLADGDLIVVPPGAPHRGRSAARVMTLGSLHVLAALPGGADLFRLFDVRLTRRVARGSRLDRILRAAADEHVVGGDPAAMTPHWTALAAKALLRHDAEAGLLRARAVDPIVAGVVERIERRLAEPTSLADLARASGFTPQHLVRRFRRALGVTPMACLAAMRLERAAALLREGALSVRAVAAAVGFADPAYFSRAFRARFGRSPSQALRGSGNPSADA